MNYLRNGFALMMLLTVNLQAGFTQMTSNGVTTYGNEWIHYDQAYVKIKIGQDGIYRITTDQLSAAGVPFNQIDASNYRIYWMGSEQTLHPSRSSGVLTESDYLEFYGEKNRSQLDRFLFSDPEQEMLNPQYGLTTDTSAYFLTWTPENPSTFRYDIIMNQLTGQLPVKKEWYLHEEKLILNSHHFKAVINSAQVRFSNYVEGEGFGSKEDVNHSFNLNTSHLALDGPTPKLHLRMTGNRNLHKVKINWNGSLKSQIDFLGTNLNGGSVLVDTMIDLSFQEVSNANTLVSNGSSSTDRVTYSVIELLYPRSFNFNQQNEVSLRIEDAQNGAYLEISDFAHLGQAPLIYDLTDGAIYTGTLSGNLIRLNLAPGSATRKLIVLHPDQIRTPVSLQLLQFDDLKVSDASYIIISHKTLFTGDHLVSQYANYRTSELGGKYKTKIIEIDQLIDQFAFGVAKHPLSIKNFTNYIHQSWIDPQFLFLIGKGLEYRESRKRNEPYDLIPVFGVPGSDNLLTSDRQSSTPLIPIGRLAARNPENIKVYLDKIKVMEQEINLAPQTIHDRAWMKRILHLGGGVRASEVNDLKRKLDRMKAICESGDLQGDVFSWSIQSQDVIDFNENETVIDLINTGTIIKTYFGHGSNTTTQFNGFEDPQFLSNKDRYSVMLSLGCHTGDLFNPQISLGESNIFAIDKGASIYMATSGLGFLEALDIFGRRWYDLIANSYLNRPVGEVNQVVIRENDANASIPIKTLMQQIVLHGDPAFKLSNLQGPDYIIDFQSVGFEPAVINTNQDSFEISFHLYNLGSNNDQNIQLVFSQQLPNGQIVKLLDQSVRSNSFINELTATLPVLKKLDLAGAHKLIIEVNQNKNVLESPSPAAYHNNILANSAGEIGVRIPLVSNGVRPISPLPYSIVSDSDLQLIASTADPLAKTQDYVIQLDTTAKFNSAFKVEQRINQLGGLIKWSPNITWTNNHTYYWRISPDSTDEQGFIWGNSSFTYLPDSPEGWCQQHYYQFLDGQANGLDIETNRKFAFSKSFNEYRIYNVRKHGTDALEFFFDGQQFGSPLGSPLKAGISIIVVNPVDQSWFINEGGSHGSVLIKDEPNLYVYDVAKSEARRDLAKFLDDVVPEGYYVLLYTHLKDTTTSFLPETWAADSLIYGENLFTALERHGAKLARQMQNLGTVPYNFFFQKNGEVLAEDLAGSKLESILSSCLTFYRNQEGSYHSTIIGPASEWDKVNWDYTFSDNPQDDIIKLAIHGLRSPDGTPELLPLTTQESTIDLATLSSVTYPYLQLSIHSADQVKRTSPSLNNWKVFHSGLPDVTLNPSAHYLFESDTANLGDRINISCMVENVSNYDMDSIPVSFTITDVKNNSYFYHQTYAPLPARSAYTVDFSFETDTFIIGEHLLSVTLNPDKKQKEVNFNNNALLQRFHLVGDQTDPILDITFDGVRIMNGDIVSPNPLIKISLKDENKSILLQDSALFKLSLRSPGGSLEILDLRDPDLIFKPATTSENIALLELNKTFVEDGIYELIISAKDASGNKAGKNDLSIQFQVITRKSASHVVPYPNPFSVSTRFLYTITGSIPEVFKIQIFTVDGSIIKEIELTHEESLKVGTHLTDYVWDGTDQFNDRLANGVYLYRVVLKDRDHQPFEHFDTTADSYFEKNIGKIVILR